MADDKQYNSIAEYLAANPVTKPFKPSYFYNRDGDMLEVWWADKPAYAQTLTSRVQIQRAQDNQVTVGVQLFGVFDTVIKNSKLYDATSTTEDWLTRVGWRKTYPNVWAPPYEAMKDTVDFYYSLEGENDAERVILGDPNPPTDYTGEKNLVHVRCDKTRGNLRRLCLGLGIELGIELNEKG